MNGVPAIVYVIEGCDGALKVGQARDPIERMKTITDRRPHKLLHTSKPSIVAERIERTAHRLLYNAGKHVRGEWFCANLEECLAALRRAERIVAGLEAFPPRFVDWKTIVVPMSRDLKCKLQGLRRAERDLPTQSEMLRRLIERAAKDRRK